ncbi:MAG: DUF4105 domain-containing protein [Bdellovibrionota bacterium]
MWDTISDPIQAVSLIIARPNRRKRGNPAAGWMGHTLFRVTTRSGQEWSVAWGGDTGHVPLSNGPASIWRGLGWTNPYPVCLEIIPFQVAQDYFVITQERALEVWKLPNLDEAGAKLFAEALQVEHSKSQSRALGAYRYLTRNCSTLLVDFLTGQFGKSEALALVHRLAPPLRAVQAIRKSGAVALDFQGLITPSSPDPVTHQSTESIGVVSLLRR